MQIQCCPSCGNKDIEKIDDQHAYCKECDVTYREEKGKKVISKEGVQTLKDIRAEQEKIKEELKRLKEGTEKVLGFTLPGFDEEEADGNGD